MCEIEINRLMILNELHEHDKFVYSNSKPQIEKPIAIKSLKYLKDDNLQVNGIITNSDVIAPNWGFKILVFFDCRSFRQTCHKHFRRCSMGVSSICN